MNIIYNIRYFGLYGYNSVFSDNPLFPPKCLLHGSYSVMWGSSTVKKKTHWIPLNFLNVIFTAPGSLNNTPLLNRSSFMILPNITIIFELTCMSSDRLVVNQCITKLKLGAKDLDSGPQLAIYPRSTATTEYRGGGSHPKSSQRYLRKCVAYFCNLGDLSLWV